MNKWVDESLTANWEEDEAAFSLSDFVLDLEGDQYIVFRLCDSLYATPILSVREILEAKPCSHVPNTVRSFLGVINIRGQIVGVIDLADRFGLQRKEAPENPVLVMFDTESGPLAVVVDEMIAVVHIRQEEIDTEARECSGIPEKFVSGIAKHQDRLIALLDLSRLLTEDELISMKDSRIVSF